MREAHPTTERSRLRRRSDDGSQGAKRPPNQGEPRGKKVSGPNPRSSSSSWHFLRDGSPPQASDTGKKRAGAACLLISSTSQIPSPWQRTRLARSQKKAGLTASARSSRALYVNQDQTHVASISPNQSPTKLIYRGSTLPKNRVGYVFVTNLLRKALLTILTKKPTTCPRAM